MQISKAAVGLIVAAGVTAGVGGAYFTTRDEAPATVQTELPRGTADSDAAVARTDAVRPEAQPPAAAAAAGVAPARTAAAPRSSRETTVPAAPAPRVDSASAAPSPVESRSAPAAEPEQVLVQESEASRVPEPSGPELIELVVSADSVIGIQLDSSVTSERARVEDTVDARVVRDVRVGDRVAIPAGSRMQGFVTVVERGGRLKERARLGVRFTSIALPDGTRLPIQTETIFREGDSQAASSSAKIGGGAIGGAIIGGILGGAKGAAIGGSVGAGAGTTAVMAGGRNEAILASGSPLTIRIEQPIVITTEN